MGNLVNTATKAIGAFAGQGSPDVGNRGSGKKFTAEEVRADLENLAAQRASKDYGRHPMGSQGPMAAFGSQMANKPVSGPMATFAAQLNAPYRKAAGGPFGQFSDPAGVAFKQKYGYQPDIMRQALERFEAQQGNKTGGGGQQQAGGGQQTGGGGGGQQTGGGEGQPSQPGGGEPNVVGEAGSLGLSQSRGRGRRGRITTLLSQLGGRFESFGG